MENVCSCRFCKDDRYHVAISWDSENLKIGVSGLMRVKDDEEFIAQSIDSCIEALDELIIVYNGCTDRTPEIIETKAIQYAGKIRYFEYEPIVYANNLTKEEYDFVKSQPIDSPHLLANYYNFGLSKVGYKYVMKIDADQIYFTDQLKEICDAYRSDRKRIPSAVNLFSFIYFYLSLLLYKKTGFDVLFFKSANYCRYRKALLSLITIFKMPVFFSGYNVFYKDGLWYSTLGKKRDNNINILPPFNGLTDHTLFTLSRKTFFKPFEQREYTLLNSYGFAVIEKFQGVRFAFPVGFMWIHLNSCRKRIIAKQFRNFEESQESFMLFQNFLNLSFSEVNCTNDKLILQDQSRRLYHYLHDSTSKHMRFELVRFISNYYIDNLEEYTLKKKS